LPGGEQGACKELAATLESIDLARDLPHCLINADFCGPNIIKSGDELTAIDWTGSGRGPRVQSLVALWGGVHDLSLVDAFVAGYRQHVQLEPEEIERLPGALVLSGLILNAWGVVFQGGMPSTALKELGSDRVAAVLIADRTRRAFS
jgi:Ser/Thr protein kinase RdoA (MazF antagonist)